MGIFSPYYMMDIFYCLYRQLYVFIWEERGKDRFWLYVELFPEEIHWKKYELLFWKPVQVFKSWVIIAWLQNTFICGFMEHGILHQQVMPADWGDDTEQSFWNM